jgi:hypothetical protein
MGHHSYHVPPNETLARALDPEPSGDVYLGAQKPYAYPH